jgi:arylsulfatase
MRYVKFTRTASWRIIRMRSVHMSDKPARPNIIVITTDQQRYDTLGVTGNAIIRTPNIDALAREGVFFSRAYCQNTVCIPSRACLHTGRYTHQHGVHYMESEIDTTPALPPWEKTFMERLQDAGYYSGAFGKIHMMQPKGYHETALTGGKGSRWTRSIGQDIGPAPLGPAYAGWLEQKRPGAYEQIYRQRREPEYKTQRGAYVNVLSDEEYVETWIAEGAMDFLKRQTGSADPFFLWVGFCAPHGPFDPPKRYTDLYRPDDMPLPESFIPDSDDPRVPSVETMQRMIAFYYALVSCIDEKVGQIIKTLERNGQRENTVIVFTSDHGEMLGDKNRFGKGCFYEPVIRMPTLIYHPRTSRPYIHSGLVETFSIAPTLLECAGIQPPVQMAAESLLPALLDGKPDAPVAPAASGRDCVLCEYVSNDRSRQEICVRTDSYKLIMQFPLSSSGTSPEVQELYDLGADPLEEDNRYNDPSLSGIRNDLKDLALRRVLATSVPAYDAWVHEMPLSLRNDR